MTSEPCERSGAGSPLGDAVQQAAPPREGRGGAEQDAHDETAEMAVEIDVRRFTTGPPSSEPPPEPVQPNMMRPATSGPQRRAQRCGSWYRSRQE